MSSSNSSPNTDRESLKAQGAQELCEVDHLFFTRYFFKKRQALKFLVNWHHRLIADVVDDVIAGRRKNVCISVSPGSSKTELVVISFIARGLALNPRARFLHLSGSDSLASLNSATAREIVTSDEYQEFWPLKIADDAKAKKRWNVLVDGHPAGGVYATSMGGQVTGFRAGHMAPGFQGAIIIDDPIKPEDAFSKSKLDTANRKLITTVKSRKANPATPMILIMQRVAENDAVGFIENGNLPGDWSFVKIPAVLSEETLKKEIPSVYHKTVGREPQQDGRFSYWPYKEPIDELLQMENGQGTDATGNRISKFVFSSQWMQAPVALGGNIIHGAHFHRYSILPKIKNRYVFVDTAQKTKARNDWSVFEEWGIGVDGLLYLIDMIRGRWEAPELQKRAIAFWAKCKGRDVDFFGQVRKMKVEDKVSGTGLIQTIKLPPHNIPVEGIERNTDKLTRVMDALPYIEAGQVCLPEAAPFTSDFVTECEAFTADDTHDFDDQVDAMCDAINDMLYAGNKMKIWESLGEKETSEKKAPTGSRFLRQYRR
jgi:predicted phage terminase large subunit-like protein